MAETLPVKKTESIFDDLFRTEQRIMRRAYDIFLGNGGILGRDLDNWLAAERELVWKPAIEMEDKDKEFDLKIAVAGIDPKDLDIEVTPDYLLVKAETRHEHKEGKGKTLKCEFSSGNLFRAVHFPKKINPDKVKAEFKNGLLRITAEIAEEARARKISIAAA